MAKQTHNILMIVNPSNFNRFDPITKLTLRPATLILFRMWKIKGFFMKEDV